MKAKTTKLATLKKATKAKIKTKEVKSEADCNTMSGDGGKASGNARKAARKSVKTAGSKKTTIRKQLTKPKPPKAKGSVAAPKKKVAAVAKKKPAPVKAKASAKQPVKKKRSQVA
jgi:hypothetical protein